MHEEALFAGLTRKVEEVAREHQIRRVTRVRLWVGALSHLTEEGMRRRWELEVPGTIAEGATLIVETSSDLSDPRAGDVLLKSLDGDG